MKNLLFAVFVTAIFLVTVPIFLTVAPEYSGRMAFAYILMVTAYGLAQLETAVKTAQAESRAAFQQIATCLSGMAKEIKEIKENPVVELTLDPGKKKKRGS